MKVRKRDIINMLASVIITVAALFIIYAVKGVYPFGSGNVFGGDLYQLYIPNFFHIYDSFHGGSLFYDFRTAGGIERNSLVLIFQPSTWFLLLQKRSQIINAVSYLLVLKFAAISLTASFSFSKLFKNLSAPFTVLISLIYTFSGYNLEYFTNIGWLDAVALYPLLILALYKMFEGKSKLPFVLILTYVLCVQTYMAYFMVVSLIVFGGLYIFTVAEKEKRKGYVYSLGAGTFISLISSLYPVYYNFKIWLSSARFEKYGSKGSTAKSNLKGLLSLVCKGFNKDIIAIMLFLGLELALACLIMLCLKCIKDKKLRKITGFFAVSAVLLCLQALCKGTDLLWHGGSRVMFPFRNGYMAAFLACLIIGFYASRYLNNNEVKEKKNIVLTVLPYAFFALFAAAAVKYSNSFYAITKNFNVVSTTGEQTAYFVPAVILFVLISLAFTALLVSKNRRFGSALILICSFAAVFVNAFGFIGNYEGSNTAVKYNSYFADCYEAGEVLGKNDVFERVSNPDTSLITNYSYIAGTNSVSNWVNSLTQEQIAPFKNLGYSTIYTRTVDSGATAFSKALLRTTDSVSKAELSESLYDFTQSTESGLNFYRNKYVLPFGLCFDGSLSDIRYSNNLNTFEYQNMIYSSLSGDKELFTLLKSADEGHKSMSVYEYAVSKGYTRMPRSTGTVYLGKTTVKTNPNSTLYLKITNDYSQICKLVINGNTQIFYKNAESSNRDRNVFFPAGYASNIAELGSFNGEELNIEYEMLDGTVNDILLYSMDNEKLEALCNAQPATSYSVKGDTVTVSMNCSRDGYAFFPLSFSKNRACTVNGKAVKAEKVLGNFTALKISGGTNEIVMRYSDKSAVLVTVFTVIAFGLSCAFVYLERMIKKRPEWLESVMLAGFEGLFAAALTLLYIMPSVAGVFIRITGLIKK